jgi:hypothetical protein
MATVIAFGTSTNTQQFTLDDFVAESSHHASDGLWSPLRDNDQVDEENHDIDDDRFLSPTKRRRISIDESSSAERTQYTENTSAEVVVAFSGFKENQSLPYNFDLRDKLLRMVEKLGGRAVSSDADDLLSFDNSVTHVVAPSDARTPRVIVAALTGKWIVNPEWVLDSAKASCFIEEKAYGARRAGGSPFEGESIYLTPRFIEEDSRTSSSSHRRHSRRDYLKAFVETFGGGNIVHHSQGAKYWVVANNEKNDDDDEDYEEDESGDATVMKWNEFVHFMYPTNEENEREDEDSAAEQARREKKRKSIRRRSPSGAPRKETIEWNIEAEPAPCPFACGRSYTSTIGMKSHLKRFHTEEQRSQSWEMPRLKFQCRYCQYHSDRRSNLERHLNRFHMSDYYGDGPASGTDDNDQLDGSDN